MMVASILARPKCTINAVNKIDSHDLMGIEDSPKKREIIVLYLQN